MKKYNRIMKKYYKKKKKNNIHKIKRTYFDSLYTRFFLSSIILLLIVLLNILFGIDVKHKINENLNITKIGYKLLSSFLTPNNDELVATIELYDSYSYDGNKNIITSSSYNGVNNFVSGTVIKIAKKDNLYSVTIQTIDDYIYTYSMLTNIECHLYQYLEENELIGTSNYLLNKHTFYLDITNNNKSYSIDSL